MRNELAKHLRTLKRSGLITEWHDRKILPGDEWDQQIQSNLNSAKIILLLVSPDFIDSDYCHDIEVARAMERHQLGEARVIPVILRPCLWKITPMASLQALPKDGIPVINTSTWPTLDAAFLDVTKGILEVAKELSQPLQQPIPQQQLAEVVDRPNTNALDIQEIEGSECGIGYGKLRDSLKIGDWKAADLETFEVMMYAIRRENPGIRFIGPELLSLPDGDLAIIDRLWVKYSHERFGFSVQKKIYIECGAMLGPHTIPLTTTINKFGDRVGWRKKGRWIPYGDRNFKTPSRIGYFPACAYIGVMNRGSSLWSAYQKLVYSPSFGLPAQTNFHNCLSHPNL